MSQESKIAFINPPVTREERFGEMAKHGATAPPLGLCYLASVLRQAGIKSRIIDALSFEKTMEETVEEILSLNPRYAGITAKTVAIFRAAELAEKIKKANPRIITIIGGAHITAVPRETMERFPQFDIGVVGEGEITIVELIQTLEENKDLRRVNGLIIRENDGNLFLTTPRPPIENLDSIPLPAWDMVPHLKYYHESATRFSKLPLGSVITSRGCPGKCLFCDNSIFGRRFRAHSANYVIEMVKYLKSTYGIKSLVFYDDYFTADRKRLKEICLKMIEEKLDLEWVCSARVNAINEEMLFLMKQAGCFQIAYGIESGNQDILNLQQKGISLERVRSAVEMTHKAGIRTKGYFMIGHPTETQKTIFETIDFAKSIPLDNFQATYFTPFPGSPAYDVVDKYGAFEKDWEKMNMWDIVFVPHGFSKNDLRRYLKIVHRKFYFRPRIIWSYIKLMRDPKYRRQLLREGLSFIKEMTT
ncbi:MAG: cobalamin B12-binding domain-containing protein [Candidatus Brocadia sp.]|jgi:radical SAM superfamily enzyme YgiQ (UPF0313 family)